MKKVLLSAFMGVLFVIGLTSMVSIPQSKNFDCKAFCETVDLEGVSNGDCMSTCNVCTNPGKGEGKAAVCICKYLDHTYPGGLKGNGVTMGECVEYYKAQQ